MCEETMMHLLGIGKVDERIPDVAPILKVHSQVEKVELAEMCFVDPLENHFLFNESLISQP
jgi:hypothetical protein